MTYFQTTQKFRIRIDPEIRNKKNCPMLTRIQHTDLAKGMLGQAKSTEKKTYPFKTRLDRKTAFGCRTIIHDRRLVFSDHCSKRFRSVIAVIEYQHAQSV